mgnify:CR=1 FL=1
MKKIISILTATRAEYGLLKPIIKKLMITEEYDIRIAVTGMHLSPEYGLTYQEIEKDGFSIDKKIDILLCSGNPTAVSKSMGLALISFSEYFEELKPNLLLVLGDRYETLAVCIAAMNARIPIAHLHGGEITEGLIDEAIRHSITKMSYLHFTSTEEYKRRVIQLGENPGRVFNVGAVGIEAISQMKFMDLKEFEQSVDFEIKGKLALLTFHPVTLENDTAQKQFHHILQALDEFDDLQIIITKANADAGGAAINRMIDEYADKNRGKCRAFYSLGQERYLNAMNRCDFIIGNSSSGIIEAPSFKKPTINIGDRQKGRVQAKSVINCGPIKSEIVSAIKKAMSKDFLATLSDMENPYGNGNVSAKVISVINEYLKQEISLKKQFYDVSPEDCL